MKIIVSAGGTGGHIYPALAIIDKFKSLESNLEVLYIGTHNRMEKDIIPKHNIPFESIEIYGINRKNLLKNFKTLSCFIKAKKRCEKIIKEFNPDCVIGVGGYVTGPVISSAHKLGYKTFIHEQNSIPGKANIYLSRFVDLIFVSFKSTLNEFPKYKTIYTGNPCSEEALKKEAIDKSSLGLEQNKKLVLFVMGSLGSEKASDILYKTMSSFKDKPYEILFVTGQNYYEDMKKRDYPKNIKIVPYIDEMTRVMKKTDLQRWVDYAREHKSVILYDSAYEAYIAEADVPHSIYECEGAQECAIEFRSFSKTAGFTGLRLGYTVVPKALKVGDVSLHSLWARRHGTKFNGAPYIVQRAGEAVYSAEGRAQIKEQIAYYMGNAKIILEGLQAAGFSVSGGVNAPYIWLKTPNTMTSWEFFDMLLEKANVVGTPGSGFGPHGEHYFRLTAFGSRENTIRAMERFKSL